ncbi:histone deacetylase family protein [Aeoliella mucimassa]|uniref:Histone deacetylase-like amidohydrolase n=1 Tax=Aeoliella mucimassa TaxID=2527972 RepID=A0A518APV1_9BACT|nr:histone deacetylase [Aeoliella mucimassa]QDU56754.1 Histone deacetylase-like amidohydrolase [Aeoliella mucimassa]
MTLLYYNPQFQEHQTGNTHPENPGRLLPIVRHMNFVALGPHCRRPSWEPATIAQLAQVHDRSHIAMVREFASKGGGWIEQDTYVSDRSADVAMLAAGAACDAVQRVVAGEDHQAFCLIRPPGHHALPNGAMGFCLFNNVATAARMATRQLDIERVLVIDWDVHHGNGTQDIFWDDPQVGFLSIHRWPFYPGTGAADETGKGDGLGTTLNVPLELGTSRTDYIDHFTKALETLAERMRPQLVIISAGFDAHHLDPVGALGLETEDYQTLTRAVLKVAETHADGRLVSVLEGGYNPEVLADCIEVHLETLMEWHDEL